MKRKTIIIGGGIAGLSAGCYGQMNGYETEIFEMHNIPGGLCTAWNRKGYTFDGCIHWVTGINPQSRLYQSWNEVGAIKGREYVRHEYIMQIEGDSGKKLVMCSDVDRLEKHLLELSPEDSALIKEIANAVRESSNAANSQGSGLSEKFRGMSKSNFIGQFKDPFLREAFSAFLVEGSSAFALIFQLALYNNKDAHWPIGGSLEFAKGIEKRKSNHCIRTPGPFLPRSRFLSEQTATSPKNRTASTSSLKTPSI